jgi:hypothetical protein
MLSAWALKFCSLIDRARELMLHGNVFKHRPNLGKWDWLVVSSRSLTM